MADNNRAIPKHVGFIMDGNRRWAHSRGLPPMEGHRQGVEALKKVLRQSYKRGVKYVSAYVFSTENWKRAEEEVSFLMGLVIKVVEHELKGFHEEGIRIVVLGSREKLSNKVLKAIEHAEALTKDNQKGTLALCFNYGGLQEIAEVVKQAIESGVAADQVTEKTVMDNLYHPEIPPLDLVVRSSGEERLSGFMLVRAAYSEFLFVKKHWPDFDADDVDAALEEYASRQRRYGA